MPDHLDPFTLRFANELQRLDEGGVSSRELGRRLGVSANTISSWRNGRSKPGLDNLRALAKELGLSIAELIGEQAECAGTDETTRDGTMTTATATAFQSPAEQLVLRLASLDLEAAIAPVARLGPAVDATPDLMAALSEARRQADRMK